MSGPPGVLVGQIAGRYSIEREIGRGATAVVYLARDSLRDQPVAIKVLRAELAQSAASHSFLREIRRHSALQHPRIVPVLDTGEHDGQLYFVLPYMEGGTLRQRLSREKQLGVSDAIAIGCTVADALHYAHRHGLIHRDVKPENILFKGEEAYLADFGVARALEKSLDDTTTSSGIVRGTMAYMSPEQASGEHDYDGRSDVYSLGCVLYEMLAGVPAFIGPTAEAVLAQRFRHAPREIRVYRQSVSPSLEAVVMKALQFAPADRFRSAGDLAQALRAAESSFEPTRPGSSSRWTRHGLWALTAAVLAITVVAALANIKLASRDRFRERDWILVADFDGPTDDPGLTNAVRELTTAELNQSKYLSTLPRSQLSTTMRLAGVPDTARVGPQLARELAFRSAIRAVLVGSVSRVRSTNNYSIVLHVVDADDGSDILSAGGAANDSTLILTVQQLARRIRVGLGERSTVIQSALPLEQVATPSFAAYRKYIEALRLQSRGDGRGSNQLLREALALDTAFASAWFAMGWNYSNERMLDSTRWAFSQALARRTRLSELQRYRLDADAAYALDYDIERAIQAYDLFLAAAPNSWAGHNNRGNYLMALGRYQDGLEAFQRAAAVHPFGRRSAQIQVMNEAATLVTLGRIAEAERAARDLTGPFAVYVRLMIATATGRWREADSVGTIAATAPSSPGWLRNHATAAAASGRASRGAVHSADHLLERAAVDAPADVARWYYRARLLLAATTGRSLPALPPALAADTTAAGTITAALSRAMNGDTLAAIRSMRRIRAAEPTDFRRLGSGPSLVEAWLDARSGRWQRAADIIGPRAREGEHDTAILDRVGSLSLRWLAAEAYAHSGRPDSAIALLELAITPEHMPGNEFAQRGLVVTFAHRQLAQWYAAAGRRADAAKHWQAFVDAMTEPDSDLLPFVTEARAALMELKPRSTARKFPQPTHGVSNERLGGGRHAESVPTVSLARARSRCSCVHST